MKCRIAAAAVLALATLAAPTASFAGPNASEFSHQFDHDQDVCVNSVKAALAQEGWAHIDVQSKAVLFADKGPLTAVIVCVYYTVTQSIIVSVVAGGPDDLASKESDRLEADLK